mgnify:CR=1 FL=1
MEILARSAGTAALFAVGYAGFRGAKKMGWPAAAMLGSLFLLGLLNLAGLRLPFYQAPVSFVSKVLSGVILGQRIDRHMASAVRKMLFPVSLASFWMVMASIATGLLLFVLAGGRLSLMTCLASSSAGGIAEMSIFAMSAGADVGIVAFFQSVRIIVLYATLPFSTAWLARRAVLPKAPASGAQTRASFTPGEIARFAAVTGALALLFEAAHFPSAYMIGAMCGAGAMNLRSGKVMTLPPWLRGAAQICLSMTISVALSPRTIHLARELFFPLAFSVTLIQALSFLLAWIMHRLTRWDVMTAVLATCPGGLSQVMFFAEDLRADPLIVGVFHAVRMISIVVCVPLIARLFA